MLYNVHIKCSSPGIITCCGGDGGGVVGMKVYKPVTTVRDCVSTSVSVKPLIICNKTFLREFPAMFVMTKTLTFLMRLVDITRCVCGDEDINSTASPKEKNVVFNLKKC